MEWILYIIGAIIVFKLIVSVIGRLGRFPIVPPLVGLIVGCAVGVASESWIWGLVTGFLSVGIVVTCTESVDK
jgi:hypothetical protein